MSEESSSDKTGKWSAEFLKQVNFGRICLRMPLGLGGHEVSSFRYVEASITKGPLHAMFSKEAALSRLWLEQGLGLQGFLIPNTKLAKEVQFPACKIKIGIIADAFKKSSPGAVGFARYGDDVQLNVLHSFEKGFDSIQDFFTILQSSAPGLFTNVYPKENGEHHDADPLSTYVTLSVFSNDSSGEYLWFWFEPDMIFMLDARETIQKEDGKARCPRCGGLNALPENGGNLVRGEIESYTFIPRKCEKCGASLLGRVGMEAIEKVEQEKSTLREIEQLSQDEKKKRLTDLLSTKIDFFGARINSQ